jgi:hypothetical protein
MIILKWILNRVWTGPTRPSMISSSGYLCTRQWALNFRKNDEYLDQLSDYQLLKEDSGVWSLHIFYIDISIK